VLKRDSDTIGELLDEGLEELEGGFGEGGDRRSFRGGGRGISGFISSGDLTASATTHTIQQEGYLQVNVLRHRNVDGIDLKSNEYKDIVLMEGWQLTMSCSSLADPR
jgi:hypothetical protein